MSKSPQDQPGLNSHYIPLKSLPKEKFKKLAPYFEFDSDVLEDAPAVPHRHQRRRGRLELAFPLIGSSFTLGYFLGGLFGIAEGFSSTNQAKGHLRRTQILNHFLKRSRSTGTRLGSITLVYCSLGVMFQLSRSKKDDGWNSVAAGATTGLLFKASEGLRGSAMGVGVGLAVGSLHAWMSGMPLK